ncbi:hypothetical protein [Peterkaempfera griseoplana]|uniref:hypothetical protein n=1 Tax=Peterkaempfera griseoplana TaxID=66896 RepID=UPI0006E1D3E0|nr:hypothetical protein [Peterkaempfera griseoplana]
MSSPSFEIDTTEVRAAAVGIRRAVDDLDQATRTLEAAVQRVTGAHYGTDPLGMSLQGQGSGVGGLAQHQQRVLQGIRQYLNNSAQLADNLVLMCDRHAENDAETAAQLRRILDGGDTESLTAASPRLAAEPVLAPLTAATPQLPLRPRIGTVVTQAQPLEPLQPLHASLPLEPLEPLQQGVPVELQEPGYHDPDQPDLDYNDRPNRGDVERPTAGGGGSHRML